jgi:sigma-E factor negative regulatory protein RseA
MSEQFKEQLSALMDGELPRDQLRFLLRRIDTDAELRQCWSRYQIVRGSLRRQTVVSMRADFSETLMQRLAHEAVPTANRRGPALLRWAGGSAIAAAVAVVALVATRPAGENPSALVAPIAAAATPASAVQDTRSASLPLPLVNFDYAQPASAISVLDMGRRYDPLHRYEAMGVGAENGKAPYVLLTAPQAQQVAPSRPEVPQQQ